ncbi:MAG: hypothetical protein GY835_25245 [bacterium]|nr:hypothetical protein [bacterium]
MRSCVIVLVLLMAAATTLAQTAPQNELPDDYLPFTLTLSDSGLVGASDYLDGFAITMDIPHSSLPDGPDIDAIIAAVRSRPITGTLSYPGGRTTTITYEVVRHRGPAEIYMKSTLGYFLWEYVSVTDDRIGMAIYWWYSPPATPADMVTLEMAARLLAAPRNWHQEDDRDCADDIESGRSSNWRGSVSRPNSRGPACPPDKTIIDRRPGSHPRRACASPGE